MQLGYQTKILDAFILITYNSIKELEIDSLNVFMPSQIDKQIHYFFCYFKICIYFLFLQKVFKSMIVIKNKYIYLHFFFLFDNKCAMSTIGI